MLKKAWSSLQAVPLLLKCSTAILVVVGKAYSYRSSNMQIDVEEVFCKYVQKRYFLCSNQEESDTRFIPYVNHAMMIRFKNFVIRSPDTDVLLYSYAMLVIWILLST